MNPNRIGESLERCFMSPNVMDSNFEDANVVDVIDRAARNLGKIAEAITPAMPSHARSLNGEYVGCLTEAVLSAANGLHRIAEAISDLAEAVRAR